EIENATRATYAVKALYAASRAEAAADAALRGTADESALAVRKAHAQANIAVAASNAAIATFGGQGAALSCMTDEACRLARDTADRALAAAQLADSNAKRGSLNRLLLVTTVAVAFAGATYFTLRRAF